MTRQAVSSTHSMMLSADDPAPVTVVNAASEHPVLLVCEHAGQAVPRALAGLGLAPGDLDRHIGWDIGAAAVTCLMARAMGAPAVLQNYSRLVIDCNRPPDAPDAMPGVSDEIPVPGNGHLSAQDRDRRIAEIFAPYQAAVTHALAHPARRAVISIHSFTPTLAGVVRPWDVAFLFRGDAQTPAHLRRALLALDPGLTIGMNQPYQIEDASDWFVPRHGEPSGLPHSLIEIRNDLIADRQGQARWANLLRAVIDDLLKG